MGRSVSTPSNAVVVAYNTFESDEDSDFFEWSEFIDSTRDYLSELWPSLRSCDEWLGREDRAIVENDHACIGISEYCGLVAYWIVPKNDGLGENWCRQISGRFQREFGSLRSIGRASNGEQFFERIEK